jgi:hypothetical protein
MRFEGVNTRSMRRSARYAPTTRAVVHAALRLLVETPLAARAGLAARADSGRSG